VLLDGLTEGSATVLAALLAAVLAGLALYGQARQHGEMQRLRLLAEQMLAGQRAEAATQRAALAATERALLGAIAAGQADAIGRALAGIRDATGAVGSAAAGMRQEMAAALRDLRENNDARLAAIQRSVNEQLHEAVERQMTASFTRVADQFAAVQKAMADVQAVTAQIGDLKRLFANVKTRGGWGEAQLRALLDDILPPGGYETNFKPRADRAEVVEFAVLMPTRGGAAAPRLAVDAKFPVEDYERLLAASEAGDIEAERTARRGLERRVRDEAKRLAERYIAPPATVEFAVMYLATDGLYAEVARIPGLLDEIGRVQRVLVLGPALFPALLRTIQLGHVTLALEQKADEIRELLGATRTEMLRMDEVLDRLGRQAGTFASTIERARVRTRAIGRRLRGVEALDSDAAEQLLGVAVGAPLPPEASGGEEFPAGRVKNL
jgi:DNA recombination protein RmuC